MIHLHIDSLTKRFGNHTVFRNITVDTAVSVFGISGSNGSGKSTLLRCIAGLLKPGSGSITWTIGEEQLRPDEMNGRIGYAAPYVELYEGMSVFENLRFLQQVNRNRRHNNPEKIGDLLKRFQTESLSEKKYGKLSTGQRQRIKLAAATLRNPPILCLDEPGSNLDEAGRRLIRQTVQTARDNSQMVVIASNLPNEIDLCEQVLDLDNVKNKHEQQTTTH